MELKGLRGKKRLGHQAHAHAHPAGAGGVRPQRRQDPCRALGAPEAVARDVFDSPGADGAEGRDGGPSTRCTRRASSSASRRSTPRPFERLRATYRKVQGLTAIQSMLAGTFRQLNGEYGFSLQAPVEPARHLPEDLDAVERGHQYLGVTNAFQLARAEFADRLVRALAAWLRSINEAALSDVELGAKPRRRSSTRSCASAAATSARRIEAIDRIQQAAAGWICASRKSGRRSDAGRTEAASVGADQPSGAGASWCRQRARCRRRGGRRRRRLTVNGSRHGPARMWPVGGALAAQPWSQ